MDQYKLVIDDKIAENLALTWQQKQIANLNSILVTKGVADPNVRKEILTDFFFALGTTLDGASAEEIEHELKGYQPRLAFVDADSHTTLYFSEAFELHSNSLWDIDEVLENQGDIKSD